MNPPATIAPDAAAWPPSPLVGEGREGGPPQAVPHTLSTRNPTRGHMPRRSNGAPA